MRGGALPEPPSEVAWDDALEEEEQPPSELAAEEEERAIVKSTTGSSEADITSILDGEQVLAMQSLVRKVPVADDVVDYAVRLVRKTRPSALADADTAQSADTASSDGISEWVSWGAGPRASQYLGDRHARGLLEIYGLAPVDRRDARRRTRRS